MSSEWLHSAFLEHPPRRVASLTAFAPPPRPVPAVSSRSENAPSSRKPTTTVKIKKKAGAKKPDADGFYDAETPEEFAKRKAETEARVAGIEALLRTRLRPFGFLTSEASAMLCLPPAEVHDRLTAMLSSASIVSGLVLSAIAGTALNPIERRRGGADAR